MTTSAQLETRSLTELRVACRDLTTLARLKHPIESNRLNIERERCDQYLAQSLWLSLSPSLVAVPTCYLRRPSRIIIKQNANSTERDVASRYHFNYALMGKTSRILNVAGVVIIIIVAAIFVPSWPV